MDVRSALQELVRLQDGDVSLHSQWALAWDAARAALAEPVAEPQEPVARNDLLELADEYACTSSQAAHDLAGAPERQNMADARQEFIDALDALFAAPPSHARDAEIAKLPWTHGCDGALGNITLWINACPHCGMPRKPVAAIDEARRKA